MSYEERWFRAVGLSFVAVLGLMAVMATGAQASEKAWLIEGKDIVFNEQLDVTSHTEFNLRVEKETNLEILCSVVEENFLKILAGTTEASGKVEYRMCKTWQGKKLISGNCTPKEPIVATVKAHLFLHGGTNYILVEPEFLGADLAIIKFGALCALPESNKVRGSLVIECAQLSFGSVVGVNCAVEESAHLLRAANQALFPEDSLLYATKAATLNGVAKVALTFGTFKLWSGHV